MPGGSQLLVAVGEPVRTHREAYTVKLGIKHRVGVRLSTGPPDKNRMPSYICVQINKDCLCGRTPLVKYI